MEAKVMTCMCMCGWMSESGVGSTLFSKLFSKLLVKLLVVSKVHVSFTPSTSYHSIAESHSRFAFVDTRGHS